MMSQKLSSSKSKLLTGNHDTTRNWLRNWKKRNEGLLSSDSQNNNFRSQDFALREFKQYLVAFKQLEEFLGTYLQNHQNKSAILKDWEYICDIRRLLGVIAIKMIIIDCTAFEKHGLDTRLWKVAYYDFYSTLRHYCKPSSPHYLACKACILQIIKSGIRQFHEILSTYKDRTSIGISPSQLYEQSLPVVFPSLSVISTMEYATLMSAYKVLIFLGDLHRYGSSSDETKNLYNAARCYDQARVIIPEKSRAYHQLGILARIKNDWISASYNFIRSYANSCETSREDLLEIFDDVTKQFRTNETSYWHYRSRMNQGKGIKVNHTTIWVTTYLKKDRVIPPPPAHPESKEEHLKDMTNMELYKKFAQTYIVFIGKLLTKIGLESLELVAENPLVYFEELLNRKVNLSWNRLTQITTLNLYMIRYINLKFKSSPDEGWGISKLNRMKRSRAYKRPDRVDDAHHMESVAFDFGFEMFSLMVQRLTRMLRLCDWSNPMLGPISIAVNLWISWLKHNSQFWAYNERRRPVFSIRRLMKSKNENARDHQDDVWVAFAELMTQLEILLLRFKNHFPSVKEMSDAEHFVAIGHLPESLYLARFDIFMHNQFLKREYFVQNKFFAEKAFLYVRFRRIYGFGIEVVKKVKILKQTCSTTGFYKVNQYMSTARIIQPEMEKRGEETLKNSCGQLENDYHVLLARIRRNLDISACKQQNNNYRKFKLKQKSKNISGDCNNARFILRHGSDQGKDMDVEPTRARMANYEAWVLMAEFGFPADMIVCPKRVVLDTNCLIRDLVYIDCLIPYLRYPLLIPVTVVLELRGLSKGGLTNKEKKIYGSIHNPEAKEAVAKNEKTAQSCVEALEYLEENKAAFQIVTSTGRYVSFDSLYDYMRDDYFDPDLSNDERILDACKYMEYSDPEIRPLDTPLRVFRNTVLVSGDRILRLRTIIVDIPTTSTASFCVWFFKAHNINYCSEFSFPAKFLRSQLELGDGLFNGPIEEEEDESTEMDKTALKKRRRAKNRGRVIQLNPQLYTL